MHSVRKERVAPSVTCAEELDNTLYQTRASRAGTIKYTAGLGLRISGKRDDWQRCRTFVKPIEVLLRPVFRAVAGPACALEGIETQVGYVRTSG